MLHWSLFSYYLVVYTHHDVWIHSSGSLTGLCLQIMNKIQVNGASNYSTPTASAGNGSTELGWDKLLIVFLSYSDFLWLVGSAFAMCTLSVLSCIFLLILCKAYLPVHEFYL